MTYATGRTYRDADSHLVESTDFLRKHADPAWRDELPSLLEVGAALDELNFNEDAGIQGHSPEVVEQLVALGDDLLKGPKWHAALGASSGNERTKALDLLGFERQVVFSSISCVPVFNLPDPVLRYAGCRAHNRAMAEFCSADDRLVGVGLLTLDDPERAVAEIEAGLELGIGAFWIPAWAPGGRSPGHPAHDPIWTRLAEAGTPFILHVGSAPLSIADEWMNDGHPERRTARGGAEVIGSKDLTVIYQAAERFVSVLVLDGVLERFPELRGGVIELGADWVPSMLRRLDHAASIWTRSEPHLAEMKRKPSEQIRDQLRFTPYPFEDVGGMIRDSTPELYLFSTDYPHPEGGRDPLARFEKSLVGCSEEERSLFFGENFTNLFPALA